MIFQGRCFVPRETLAEVIQDWVASTGLGDDTAHRMLSERTGVADRTIRGIVRDTLKGRDGKLTQRIGFDVADKLVCAMGCPEEWVFGRLAEHYGPLELSPNDIARMSEEEKEAHFSAALEERKERARVNRRLHFERTGSWS